MTCAHRLLDAGTAMLSNTCVLVFGDFLADQRIKFGQFLVRVRIARASAATIPSPTCWAARMVCRDFTASTAAVVVVGAAEERTPHFFKQAWILLRRHYGSRPGPVSGQRQQAALERCSQRRAPGRGSIRGRPTLRSHHDLNRPATATKRYPPEQQRNAADQQPDGTRAGPRERAPPPAGQN